MGVWVGSGARERTCTLFSHGMVGRGRVFGGGGCTVALHGGTLDMGCHHLGSSLKSRVATRFILSLRLWEGL